jgi:hypothetical protein
MVETIEEAFQQSVTAGIDALKVGGGLERVSTVAASPTRHLHLSEHALASFEDGDCHLR